MTNERLTALLAERVMGWGIGPDRFMMGERGWKSRWRFQPAEKIEDAFQLLEKAAPQHYAMFGDETGYVHVRVQIADVEGEAHGRSKALVISCAVARAVGIEVEP